MAGVYRGLLWLQTRLLHSLIPLQLAASLLFLL